MLKRSVSFLVVLCILFSPIAFAGEGRTEKLFSSTAVASTAVVTSRTINVQNGGYFGFHYKALSASSTPDLKIEFLMSSTCTTAATDFVEPSGASDIETNLVGETWVVKSFSPPPMSCLRIQVTGNAGNNADTVFTGTLFIQEP